MLMKNCDQCGKTFSSQRSLKDHLLNVHPKTLFHCYHCEHVSKKKQHLSIHMKVHFKTRNSVSRLLCAMCGHLTFDRISMLRHYVQVHDVPLVPRKFKFKTYDDFLLWKSSLEKTKQCSYVTDGGPKRTFSKTSRHFKCYRDGFYSSKGKGMRNLKVRGSCKINGVCPSKISCTEDRHTGVVEVSYIAVHVGHEANVGRLNLTKDEKAAIAQKIAAKVPFGVILDDIKYAGIKDKIDRSNLVTRKDLWNIKRDYNLNEKKLNFVQ